MSRFWGTLRDWVATEIAGWVISHIATKDFNERYLRVLATGSPEERVPVDQVVRHTAPEPTWTTERPYAEVVKAMGPVEAEIRLHRVEEDGHQIACQMCGRQVALPDLGNGRVSIEPIMGWVSDGPGTLRCPECERLAQALGMRQGDMRDPHCVQAWPECVNGEYNPSCCRFPKSCSC